MTEEQDCYEDEKELEDSQEVVHPKVEVLDDAIKKVESARATLERDLNSVSPDLLSDEIFNQTSVRLRSIINNDPDSESPIVSNNKSHSIRLSRLTYVDCVYFEGGNFTKFDSITFNFFVDNEKVYSKKVNASSGGAFEINVGRLIIRIEFKTPQKFLTKTSIKSIDIIGTEINKFKTIEQAFEKVDSVKRKINTEFNSTKEELESYKNEYNEILDKINHIDDEIKSGNFTINKLDKEIVGQKKVIDDQNARLKSNAMMLSEQRADLENVKRDVTKETQSFKQLMSDIYEMQSQLATLKSNINLFPSELSDFAKEGGKSINKYLLVSILPMLVVVFISIHLYSSASDLADYITRNSGDVDLIGVIVSRLPYVLLSLTILAVCGSLIRGFISEAIRITEQKLNLSKISIIAKDVSDSSCSSLDISEDEIYEKRVSLKMELLKEHLKSYISEDYIYQEKEPEVRNNPPTKIESEDDGGDIDESEVIDRKDDQE